MNDVLEYKAPSPDRRHSRAGIASLALGVISVAPGFYVLSNPISGQLEWTFLAALSITMNIAAVPLVGFGLGILGVRSAQKKRVTAFIGLCLNALVLLLIPVSVILYVALSPD